MYVMHDLFKQQKRKPLTLYMVLFPGYQGSESLSNLLKDTVGKQGFKSSLVWFQSPCLSPVNIKVYANT